MSDGQTTRTSDGQAVRTQELLALAGQLQKQAADVERLRNEIKSKFPDEELKPFVGPVLATEHVDGETLTSRLQAAADKIGTTAGDALKETRALVVALLGRWFMVVGLLLIVLLFVGSVLIWKFGVPKAATAVTDGTPFAFATAIVLVLGIFAIGLLAIGFVGSFTDFRTFWPQVEKVLQSGVFYFFAGLAMLMYAIHATNVHEHPALTFLIAMLGVAIMLFGTGSQAAGAIATAGSRLPATNEARGSDKPGDIPSGGESGAVLPSDHPAAVAEARAKEVKDAAAEGKAKVTDAEKSAALASVADLAQKALTACTEAKTAAMRYPHSFGDWGPVKANAAIAGGAAVLTIVFGLGVIHFHKDIREVFADYDQYQLVYIDACATYGRLCSEQYDVKTSANDPDRPSRLSRFSLTDYSISAEMAGRSLYVSREGSQISLLVFGRDLRDSTQIRLYARRHPSPPQLDDFVVDLDLLFAVTDLLGPPEAKPDVLPGAPASTSPETKGLLDCLNMKIPSAGCKLEWKKTERRDRLKTVRYGLNFSETGGTVITANRGDATAMGVDANFVAPQIQIQPQ